MKQHKGFSVIPATTLSTIGDIIQVDTTSYVEAVYPVNTASPTKTVTYYQEEVVEHLVETPVKHVKTAWMIIGIVLAVVFVVMAIVCFIRCRNHKEE